MSYDYWCEWVYQNNCQFGIVKTAHESKLGTNQKMSYQMVNSLDESIMENVVKDSVDYVNRLKQDNDFFLDYLKKNVNFSNDYDVLISLCEHNSNFYRSSYFRQRKKKIIESYVFNLKNGQIIQNAENLILVGSPYAMLLYAATGEEDSVDEDPTFCYEENTVQGYTERFGDGEYLAFFRSPFNGKYNLSYVHNVHNELFRKYFNLGKQILAINVNGTDFEDRNNGCDFDSDFGYTTNQPDIVEHARRCYLEYPTIVNNIPKDKNVYNNTLSDFAKVDSLLAESQTDIGESSNLAQIAQTYACNFSDQKFQDYVCILSVLAQVAIDNSKRRYDLSLSKTIKKIKMDMDIKTNKYPKFWGIIKKNFNKRNINSELHCPMNYLFDLELTKFRDDSPTLPMSSFFVKHTLDKDKKTCKKVEELITKYSFDLLQNQIDECRHDKLSEYLLLRSDFDSLIRDIQKTYISSNYTGLISWLIDRAFIITPKMKYNSTTVKSKLSKNKPLLLKTLYEVNKKSFLQCFICDN